MSFLNVFGMSPAPGKARGSASVSQAQRLQQKRALRVGRPRTLVGSKQLPCPSPTLSQAARRKGRIWDQKLFPFKGVITHYIKRKNPVRPGSKQSSLIPSVSVSGTF